MGLLAEPSAPARHLLLGGLLLAGMYGQASAQEPERRPSVPIPVEAPRVPDTLPPALPGLPLAEAVEETPRPWLIHLNGLYGVTIARYNRVDGLVPAWGLDLEPTDPTRVPALGGHYGRATTHSRGYWSAWIAQRLPLPGEVRLRFEHFQRPSTYDEWRITPRENDLSTFLTGSDLVDWWREKGYLVEVTGETVDGRLGGRLAFMDASQHSEPDRSPFVLFGGDEDFRANPSVEEGDLHGLSLSASLDTRDVQSPLLPSPGWRLSAELEGAGGPLGGDLDFTRARVDLRRYNRLGTDAWWDWRLVWMGPLDDDGVPSQRKASLGGPGSLRGFPAARFVGEEALQVSTEARLPLPVTRPIDILFLSWHLVGLADAGIVDDYGDWHADVGAGVSGINLFSYVGLFVAQRVTDTGESDDGPRFIIRLRRDF
ncbi:MAG: BamA/TamA family outer membrane protein [Gemmatimonadota bacterium]